MTEEAFALQLKKRTEDFQTYWTGVKRATDKLCSRFVEKFKVLRTFLDSSLAALVQNDKPTCVILSEAKNPD